MQRPKRRQTRWLAAGVISLLMLGLAMTAGTARAEGVQPLQIQSMDLSVRPEYDRADVLVTYDFSITNTGQQPHDGEIMFHAPTGATSEVHICEQEGSNKHASCRPYRTEEQGGETLFVWKPGKPIAPGATYPIYVEYYYNPIQGTADKQINFRYHPSYPVQRLNLSVAQPLRATNFTLEPATAQSGSSPDGLTYHFWTYENVSPEQPVSLTIRYTKPDNQPSIAPAATGGTTQAATNPAVLAIGGVLVLGFVGLLYVALRRPPGTAHRRRRAAPASARAPVPERLAAAPAPASKAPRPKPEEQRRLARQRLLEGQISEQTYLAILAELQAEVK